MAKRLGIVGAAIALLICGGLLGRFLFSPPDEKIEKETTSQEIAQAETAVKATATDRTIIKKSRVISRVEKPEGGAVTVTSETSETHVALDATQNEKRTEEVHKEEVKKEIVIKRTRANLTLGISAQPVFSSGFQMSEPRVTVGVRAYKGLWLTGSAQHRGGTGKLFDRLRFDVGIRLEVK